MAVTSKGIPLFDDLSAVAPIQAPLNAQSNALNAALVAAEDGYYGRYTTLALLTAAPGTAALRHATVYADTADKNGDYIYSGVAWVRIWSAGVLPFATSSGITAVPTGGTLVSPLYYTTSFTINFPAGRFTAAPVVTASAAGTGVLYSSIVGVPTTASFVAVVTRLNAAIGAGTFIHWHATQMTPTTGAG
jgi:hypothetical protein